MHNLKEIRKNFDDFKDALKGRFLKIDFNQLKDLDNHWCERNARKHTTFPSKRYSVLKSKWERSSRPPA